MFLLYFTILACFSFGKEKELPICECISGEFCCPQPCTGFDGPTEACMCWINKDRKRISWSGSMAWYYFPDSGSTSPGMCEWCQGLGNETEPDLSLMIDWCPDRTIGCGNFGSKNACSENCEHVQSLHHLFVKPYTVEFTPNTGGVPGHCICHGAADPCIYYDLEHGKPFKYNSREVV